MKYIIYLICLLWTGLAFADNKTDGTEKYNLDPMHTYVEWHISHFGFSAPSGKWMVKSGTLELNKAKPQNSKVSATIQVDTLATGLSELDEHLKAPLFFNVAKFPTATFVSNEVKLTGKNSAKVSGILTLHGVSKPVVLNVKLNKEGVNPVSDKQSVGFSATTQIKRSEFGMTAYTPGLGDDVKIEIQSEATRAN